MPLTGSLPVVISSTKIAGSLPLGEAILNGEDVVVMKILEKEGSSTPLFVSSGSRQKNLGITTGIDMWRLGTSIHFYISHWGSQLE